MSYACTSTGRTRIKTEKFLPFPLQGGNSFTRGTFADDLLVAQGTVKDTGQLALNIRNGIDESIQFVEQVLLRLKA